MICEAGFYNAFYYFVYERKVRGWTVVRQLIFVRIRSVGNDMLIISVAVITIMRQNRTKLCRLSEYRRGQLELPDRSWVWFSIRCTFFANSWWPVCG